jgi:hypothetical protein
MPIPVNTSLQLPRAPMFLALSTALFAHVGLAMAEGSVEIFAMDANGNGGGFSLIRDQDPAQPLDADGSIRFALPSGAHQLVIRKDDKNVLEIPIVIKDDVNSFLTVNVDAQGAGRFTLEETANKHSTGTNAAEEPVAAETDLPEESPAPPGAAVQVFGVVRSLQTDEPLVNVLVRMKDQPYFARTDEDGKFSFVAPVGTAVLRVSADRYVAETSEPIRLTSGSPTLKKNAMPPLLPILLARNKSVATAIAMPLAHSNASMD